MVQDDKKLFNIASIVSADIDKDLEANESNKLKRNIYNALLRNPQQAEKAIKMFDNNEI